MGEIKDFEDHLLKNMIRFVRTLTIFFFWSWYSQSLKMTRQNTDFESHTQRKLKFF